MKLADPSEPILLESLAEPALAEDPSSLFAAAHSLPGKGLFQDPIEGGLVAIRYDLLKAISKHPACQAQDRTARVTGPGEDSALYRLFDNHPVFMNEPVHMLVHRIAYRAIAHQRAPAIREAVKRIALDVIETLLEKKGVDLVADYAFAISSRYWAEMLGGSADDSEQLAGRARAIGAVLSFTVSDDDRARAGESAEWLRRFAENHESGTKDLVDGLVKDIDLPGRPENASALLASMTFDGVDGGGGMTGNLIACLLENPPALHRLRRDPSRIAAAWTESARLAPALLGLFRCPVEDVVVEGVHLPAGVNILMLNAAGNQDPRVFDEPSIFDIDRSGPAPLTFGGGGRACVGKMLARIQGEVAAEVLLERTAEIEIQVEAIDWGKPGLLRVATALPVTLKPT